MCHSLGCGHGRTEARPRPSPVACRDSCFVNDGNEILSIGDWGLRRFMECFKQPACPPFNTKGNLVQRLHDGRSCRCKTARGRFSRSSDDSKAEHPESKLVLMDCVTGGIVACLKWTTSAYVSSTAFSPDGRLLFTSADTVRISRVLTRTSLFGRWQPANHFAK